MDLYSITNDILPRKIHELMVEKGLSTANIEHAYKLVDMYKDLKQVEHWDNEDGDDGQSQRGRKRDRMGRYSRDDGYAYAEGPHEADAKRRYLDAKHSYRTTKSSECKRQLMDTVNEYMEDFAQEMEEMMRDADCKEERDTISRYIQQIRNLT